MALGFATVDLAIYTRIKYNLTPETLDQYHKLLVTHKIKPLYEKYALLQILSFDGYDSNSPMCRRTLRAFHKLIQKHVIIINNGKYSLK